MNTILAKATTWTIASVVGATIASLVIEKGVMQLDHVSDRLAGAVGNKKPAAQTGRTPAGTPLEALGVTKDVGVGGMAFELSGRLTRFVFETPSADRSAAVKD